MATITLSIDDEILESGKKLADEKNLTLDGLVQNCLKRAIGPTKEEVAKIMDSIRATHGNSEGTGFSREETYQR